jgi:hypothetical protein
MERSLRNPILHFIVLGGLLFTIREGWRTLYGARTGGRAPIVISTERIKQLQTDFARQGGVQPTSEQLQALIQEAVDDELLYRAARQLRLDFQDRSIRTRLVQKMRAVSTDPTQNEEALYREAVQLGLDDDLVIKRVLRQKMRLLLQQESHPAALQEQDIRDYLLRHRERFMQPETVTFSHIFLSARVRGDRLDEEARTVLMQLRSRSTQPEATDALSDPFPLGLQLRFQSRGVIARYFGEDFADQVFNVPPKAWAGPVASPFGLHVVWVQEKVPEQMPPLDMVWQQIVGEIQQERGAERLANGLRRLRSLHDIRIEGSSSDITQDALEKKGS